MNQLKEELKQLTYIKGNTNRLIRINEVIKLTSISKSYIYQLVSKNLFPKPIHLIPGGSSVAWVEGEVLNWIDERIKQRDMEVKSNG